MTRPSLTAALPQTEARHGLQRPAQRFAAPFVAGIRLSRHFRHALDRWLCAAPVRFAAAEVAIPQKPEPPRFVLWHESMGPVCHQCHWPVGTDGENQICRKCLDDPTRTDRAFRIWDRVCFAVFTAAVMLALLSWLASAAISAELPALLLPGVTDTAETLESPTTQGWATTGNGATQVQDRSPWRERYSGAATILRSAGASPLIHAQGSNWRITDCTLLGATKESPAERCGIGLLVAHRGAFNGGKATLARLSFAHFIDAIRTGLSSGDHGNDNLGLDDLTFAHCDHALTLAATQSMHHTATRWHARKCDVVINVEGGGKLDLRGLDTDCHGCLVRTVGDGKQIGPNNGVYTLTHVTVDHATGDRLTLVDQQQTTWLRVNIDRLYMPSAGANKSLDATLRGRDSLLRLSRVENLPRKTQLRLLDGARCVLSDSELPCDPAELLTSDSTGTLVVRDCWRGSRFIALDVVGGGG